MSALTAERLRDLARYDQNTGLFTNLVGRPGISVGAVMGCLTPHGYILIGIDYESHYAHRLAYLYMTGEWPPDEIDHRDLNRSNNAWSNIRPATRSQNKFNIRRLRNNSTGYCGVTWCKRKKKFQAQYKKNGKYTWIGYFDTAEEASAAYQEAIAYRGEFRPIIEEAA